MRSTLGFVPAALACVALGLTGCASGSDMDSNPANQPMAGFGAAGAAGLGTAGTDGFGEAGAGVAGTGVAGTGAAGAGVAGTGAAGAGVAGSGEAGSGEAGSGEAGMGGAGMAGMGGAGEAGMGGSGEAGMGGAGMAGTGGAGMGLDGECCSDGNCLCRASPPSSLSASSGPFDTDDYRISTGTVHYPTDAEPPFAAVAVCGGFTNTGPEMAGWGPFYASHGIVTVIVTTGALDVPAIRASKLLAAVEELKMENSNSGSPLFEKLAGRYGTSGYSMGGGGTTIATGDDPSLMTSVGLAAWAPEGRGVETPTLLLCGTSDGVAPCSQSQGAYGAIPGSTPKMMIEISGASHFSWFGPNDAGRGTSGGYALAFQKVFLEGDERWRDLLLDEPSNGSVTTNIQ